MNTGTKKILLTTVITMFVLLFVSVSFFIGTELNKNVSNAKLDEISASLDSCISNLESCANKPTIVSDKNNTILPETVIMNVPLYTQTHSASCEFASTHAAMLYYGVDIPEDTIIASVGSDNTPRTVDADGTIRWGNPQLKFVGSVDASNIYYDGYGVYNDPIYKFLSENGFSSSISKMNWDVNDLYNYVRQGYPVILWISNDLSTQIPSTWIAPDGSVHKWILKEHAVVLRGVDVDNVYYVDVGLGVYKTATKADFERGFANLDNMAVVVKKGKS